MQRHHDPIARTPFRGALLIVCVLLACSTATEKKKEAPLTAAEVDADAEQLMDALEGQVDCRTLFAEIQLHPQLLTAVAKAGPWDVELRYRPALCRACAEQMDAQIGDSALQQLRRELASTDLYVLRLRTHVAEEEAPTEGELLPHIKQVIGGDTVPAVFLHKEATTSSAPFASYLIGFDTPERDGPRAVIIDGVWKQAVRLELSNERLDTFIHLGQEPV